MKNLLCFIFTILMLTSVASCNSDSDYEGKTEDYTFSYSIKVNDNKGESLLTTLEDFRHDSYNEHNISLKYSKYRTDDALFSISKNDNDETLLNITVEGVYLKSYPILEMTAQWGTSHIASMSPDLLKYELKKVNGTIQCDKIWFNGELKWESKNSDSPIFSIVKERNTSSLPPAKPISLNHSEKVKSENKFAFNLFKKAVQDDLQNNRENSFVSPLSVNLALNMLVNGAEGETKEEILKTLESQDYSIEQINEHSKELSNALTSVDPSTSISIANSIWYDFNFSVKNTFIQTNKNYFNAEVNAIDFSDSEYVIKTINKWSADKTRNKIPEVLSRLPANVVIMLINALHFKSNWSESKYFNVDFTTKKPFYAADGSEKEVDMMHNKSRYLYKSNSYASYLAIPFGNNAYNMVFILPDEDKTMQEVIDNIDYEPSWITSDNMKTEMINLSLPKFKLDFSYNMEDFILPEMGMKIPFLPGKANFNGISNNPIFISCVINKTTIEVNEEGAEAAAITVILSEVDALDNEKPKIIDFNVNRPFIFSICEKSTGTILFIGKIDNILK